MTVVVVVVVVMMEVNNGLMGGLYVGGMGLKSGRGLGW